MRVCSLSDKELKEANESMKRSPENKTLRQVLQRNSKQAAKNFPLHNNVPLLPLPYFPCTLPGLGNWNLVHAPYGRNLACTSKAVDVGGGSRYL